jgi:hypothetical protein
MTTAELLETVRRVEVRTNRPVNGLVGSRSLKPASERVGISAGMINGKHTDFVAFDGEVNPILEARHSSFANRYGFLQKDFWVSADAFEQGFKLGFKFPPQARLPFFIPSECLQIVRIRQRSEPHPIHFQPKRLRAFSRTCSQGIPACGRECIPEIAKFKINGFEKFTAFCFGHPAQFFKNFHLAHGGNLLR